MDKIQWLLVCICPVLHNARVFKGSSLQNIFPAINHVLLRLRVHVLWRECKIRCRTILVATTPILAVWHILLPQQFQRVSVAGEVLRLMLIRSNVHWSVLLDCTNSFLSACLLSRLLARLSSRVFFDKMQFILSSGAAESPRVCLQMFLVCKKCLYGMQFFIMSFILLF